MITVATSMNNKTSQRKGVVPSAEGAGMNEPNEARPEGAPVSAKRGPGRPRKQTSKSNAIISSDQGNRLSYDSEAERVAEAISLSLMDAPSGEAAAPRKRLDFSSLRSRGSNNVRIMRSQSAERERCAQSDDFRETAQDSSAEAEAPRGEAQRPVRIEFDSDVDDDVAVEPASLEVVLAEAELQIREQVNKRVEEARALRARELNRQRQEEERRRQAAAVEAEVQRRVQQVLLEDEAEVKSVSTAPTTNVVIESQFAHPYVAVETSPPSPLTPSVAALMASAAGGGTGAAAAGVAAAASEGDNFAMKINQLQRYMHRACGSTENAVEAWGLHIYLFLAALLTRACGSTVKCECSSTSTECASV